MGVPLSRVLHDFSVREVVAPAPDEGVAEIPLSQPCDDMAVQLEEAYARGFAAAQSAAQAEHDRKLAETTAAADERHEAERARWASEQADALSTQLAFAVDLLETRIADTAARILTPFVKAELRRASLDALAESIGTLLSGANQPALRISGPEDLLEALRERLDTGRVAVDWAPGEGAEVTVCANDSVIETELQSWLDRFAGARQ